MNEKVNYLLFKVLIIFIFYDLILENSIFIKLMNVKYLCLILLLSSALLKKVKLSSFKIFNIGFILFYIYHIIIGIFSISGFLQYGLPGFMVYKQYFLLPVCIYLFSNFTKLTKVKYEQLYLFLIKTAVIYVFINTFLYLFELPIWTDYRPWWGRMTQGYPTIDVISLAYVLCALFLYKNIKISSTKRTFYSIIIILGLCILASGTGFLLMTLIIMATIYVSLLGGKNVVNIKKNIGYTSMFMLIIAIATISILELSKINSIDLFKVAENRISIILGVDDNLGYNTLDMRAEQYDFVKKSFLKSPFDQIFGVGFGAVDYRSGYPIGRIYVENQYGLNTVTSGIISNIFYILAFILSFWRIFRIINLDLDIRILGVLCPVIFSIASFTTVPIGSYSAVVSFSILYSGLLSMVVDNLEYTKIKFKNDENRN
ncbi:hypothetical protein D0T84_14510 [Dysgonomonas sp. 521]|uniref:hypothetical protein n=1 Tax=Dysgonomonas sp. 521 TaxID=2302932 RepID=UPI0013CFB13A|nr:hypothetical protein [Dysgonomonas sp. 521]NDV96115.1 hypothetical protein [Dysgonomonas sp. 521]